MWKLHSALKWLECQKSLPRKFVNQNMNEIAFRERWCASKNPWLPSDRDFDIFWFLAQFLVMFKNVLDSFQKIIANFANEKWKNGLSDTFGLKLDIFSISSYYFLQLRLKWKMTNFRPNLIRKAIFPLFIYQKVSNI